MYISLNNLGSNYYTRIELMDVNQNEIALSSEGSPQISDIYPQTFITEKYLQPDTYIVSTRRNSGDRILNLQIERKSHSELFETDLTDIGSRKRSFEYTDQKTVRGYNKEYLNKYNENNIFYKIELTSPMYISANNEGSDTKTRIVLLDKD